MSYLLNYITERVRRKSEEKLVPITSNDSAVTVLKKYSPIGQKLLEKAQDDGIRFYRNLDTLTNPFYEDERLISLPIDSDFDSLAHELAHHNHTKANRISPNYSIKDNLTIRLIGEAEAYSVQALVILEVLDNTKEVSASKLPEHESALHTLFSDSNFLKSSPEDLHLILNLITAMAKIDSICPEFSEVCLGNIERPNRLAIARHVFDSYLLGKERGYQDHLKHYVPITELDTSNFINMTTGATLAGVGISSVFNNAMPTYLTSAAFTYMGYEFFKMYYNSISKVTNHYDTSSSFKTLMRDMNIGHVPGLEGNYLTDVEGADWDSTAFKELQKHISDKVDAQQSPTAMKAINGISKLQNKAVQYGENLAAWSTFAPKI